MDGDERRRFDGVAGDLLEILGYGRPDKAHTATPAKATQA